MRFLNVVAGANGGNQIQTGTLNASDFATLPDDGQAGFARHRPRFRIKVELRE